MNRLSDEKALELLRDAMPAYGAGGRAQAICGLACATESTGPPTGLRQATGCWRLRLCCCACCALR